MTYSKEAVAAAKAKGLHLVKLEIFGKHAKKSGASMSGAVGPQTAEKVWEFFTELCDVKKRMK